MCFGFMVLFCFWVSYLYEICYGLMVWIYVVCFDCMCASGGLSWIVGLLWIMLFLWGDLILFGFS